MTEAEYNLFNCTKYKQKKSTYNQVLESLQITKV